MTATAEAVSPLRAELVLGMAELKRQRPRLAAEKFRQVLDTDPDDHRARLGLLKAYDALGRCGEIMLEVPLLEASAFWMPDAMMVTATCEADVGAWDAARGLYEAAIERRTESPEATYRLGRLCLDIGDLDCFAGAVDATLERERGPAYALLLEAERAVRGGAADADAQLIALGIYAFVPDVRRGSRVLQVQRLLDDGDPFEADERTVELVTQNVSDQEIAALRAETLRRSGRPVDALSAIERPTLRARPDTLGMAAVRARIYADLGRLDEAHGVAVGLPARHPEVIATRWYLARAADDAAGATRWADRLKAHPLEGWRPLEPLIPISEESP